MTLMFKDRRAQKLHRPSGTRIRRTGIAQTTRFQQGGSRNCGWPTILAETMAGPSKLYAALQHLGPQSCKVKERPCYNSLARAPVPFGIPRSTPDGQDDYDETGITSRMLSSEVKLKRRANMWWKVCHRKARANIHIKFLRIDRHPLATSITHFVISIKISCGSHVLAMC